MQYKESFQSNLVDFLNEYQDNTKTFFLQNEKKKYQAYQNALTKIVDQMKLFTRDELNQNLVHRSIAADLKLIDQNIYNSIITELNPVQDEVILSLSAAKKDRIKIDETALENHIKSSIVILKFISEESTHSNIIINQNNRLENTDLTTKVETIEQLQIKTIDLNLENLLSIGLTIDIIKNNFEEWVLKRDDIFIDFENNLIYTGIDKFKKNLETTKSLLFKDLENEGMSKEEIVLHFKNIESELKSEMEKSISYIHEEQRLEFVLKSIKNISGALSDAKNELIEKEIAQLQNFNYPEEENFPKVINIDFEDTLSFSDEINPYPRIFKDYWICK